MGVETGAAPSGVGRRWRLVPAPASALGPWQLPSDSVTTANSLVHCVCSGLPHPSSRAGGAQGLPALPETSLFEGPVQPPSGVVDMLSVGLLSPSSPLAAPRRRQMKSAGSQVPAVAMGQHLWAGRQLYSPHVPSTWGGLCRERACDGPGTLAISGIQG